MPMVLASLTMHRSGGARLLPVCTSRIISFQARDYMQERIRSQGKTSRLRSIAFQKETRLTWRARLSVRYAAAKHCHFVSM